MRETYSPDELDQRVTLRRVTTADNAYGTPAETATDLGTYWAKVRPRTGGERQRAEQTEARSMYLIVFRRGVHDQHTITESDRLVWNGEEFNIRFIEDRPRSLYIALDCERNAPTG